ncbi:hypothetical protein M422DRAFT_193528, partial [Sphaerobolus stellatus SS14]
GYGASWLAASVQRSLASQQHYAGPRGELKQYFGSPVVVGDEDIVVWWGLHSNEYPTVACIARDFLTIQGSSVPCKCCFSSSRQTGTTQCNSLLPKTFEALQILKNAYKSGDLKTVEETLAFEGAVGAEEFSDRDILVS